MGSRRFEVAEEEVRKREVCEGEGVYVMGSISMLYLLYFHEECCKGEGISTMCLLYEES